MAAWQDRNRERNRPAEPILVGKGWEWGVVAETQSALTTVNRQPVIRKLLPDRTNRSTGLIVRASTWVVNQPGLKSAGIAVTAALIEVSGSLQPGEGDGERNGTVAHDDRSESW